MANDTVKTTVYANNATITTALSACSHTVNITLIVQDLYNLYQNYSSNSASNVFYNISMVKFDCITPLGKYFQHVITFTQSISIHIQVSLVSIYFDYITQAKYLTNDFNGFFIDHTRLINFSSASLNYTSKSDACSSSLAAQDSLCPLNSSKSLCVNLITNPWIFKCNEISLASTNVTFFHESINKFLIASSPSILNSWHIGFICTSSSLILLLCLCLVGYLYRRHSRSKNFILSSKSSFDDLTSIRKSGIPQGQIFQRMSTIRFSALRNSPIFSSNHDNISECTPTERESQIILKPSVFYNQLNVFNRGKIYNTNDCSNIPMPITTPAHMLNVHANPLKSKVNLTSNMSQTIFNMSMNRPQPGTYQLDSPNYIQFHQPIKAHPKKSNNTITEHWLNPFSIDESLHDEDAWMSILDVVNAEIDLLNRLDNEQNHIKTIL